MKLKSLSRVQLLATSWTAAYQAPPSMGFSRQVYWSGLPLPSPQNKLLALKSLSQSFLLGEPKLRHHGKGERLVCNMILVFLELSASWDAGLSVPDVGKSWTSLDRLTTIIGR